MQIILDAMGGDRAPEEALLGTLRYLESGGRANLTLVGNEGRLAGLSAFGQLPADRFWILPSTEVIEMHEHPAKALRSKPQSSIALGFAALAGGDGDAFLSAGNTGAMLAGAMYALRPVEGILRPVISTIIPKEGGGVSLLLDVGLNADPKPEHLAQFAQMGAVYASLVYGIASPRVGLLNIGEEEGKGNALAQAAYPLLKAAAGIDFIGNVEGRDILGDVADVIVCDGFTGNVVLKMAESMHAIARRQVGAHPYFDRFEPEQYGGTPVLGIAKPVIIGHGSSGALAFANMLHLAEKLIQENVMHKISNAIVG